MQSLLYGRSQKDDEPERRFLYAAELMTIRTHTELQNKTKTSARTRQTIRAASSIMLNQPRPLQVMLTSIRAAGQNSRCCSNGATRTMVCIGRASSNVVIQDNSDSWTFRFLCSLSCKEVHA